MWNGSSVYREMGCLVVPSPESAVVRVCSDHVQSFNHCRGVGVDNTAAPGTPSQHTSQRAHPKSAPKALSGSRKGSHFRTTRLRAEYTPQPRRRHQEKRTSTPTNNSYTDPFSKCCFPSKICAREGIKAQTHLAGIDSARHNTRDMTLCILPQPSLHVTCGVAVTS